jgi:regulator of cell morphogenesis and NO signaling
MSELDCAIELLPDINSREDESIVFCPQELLSVPDLIDHIIKVHHEYLRTSLPLMRDAAEQLVLKYSSKDEDLGQLLFYFETLSSDQLEHIAKEEAILFPYIKSLYSPDGISAIKEVCFGSVKSPISVIEMEHENVHVELRTLRKVANNYRAPVGADPDVINFYKDLEALEKELQIHLYKENNILHPKAIAREDEVYS